MVFNCSFSQFCFRSQLIAANKVIQEKLATSSNIVGLQNVEHVGGGVVTSDVENNNRLSSDLARLTQQKAMLLKSGVYSPADNLIRALDNEIEEAKNKRRKWKSLKIIRKLWLWTWLGFICRDFLF